ncbi:hypothetical protein AWB89_03845 [Mycobacterium paraense]|nr:hypothetical protein AWB89_03845 [Mycobacterium paraense]
MVVVDPQINLNVVNVEHFRNEAFVRHGDRKQFDRHQTVHQRWTGRTKRSWIARKQTSRIRNNEALVWAGEPGDKEIQTSDQLGQLEDRV